MNEEKTTIEKEISDTSMNSRPHVVILGAGASFAAFPSGDRNGRKLPLMKNLVEMIGLEPLLDSSGLDYDQMDFESTYANLCNKPKFNDLRQSIERRVYDYFYFLELPDSPTIYDYLVLSLRGKDLIATFNWDPLLYYAAVRNHSKFQIPKIAFLHGNVAIGYCEKDKTAGSVKNFCKKCCETYKPVSLLYPIKIKNYANDHFISGQWNDLRRWLRGAFMVTIFGYSAPASDAEAIEMIKKGWGQPTTRNYEQIEFIDLKGEEEILRGWANFIHTHHYDIYTSFYDSWIARHPRRTCEAMWNQTQEMEFLDNNSFPLGSSLEELWNWFERFKLAELSH